MAKTEKPQRLYRILDFTRVVQIFEKKELFFASPNSWDDPYEKRIKHSKVNAVFAQCWSSAPISDAMWRIYSHNGMVVRVSTTDSKLRAALKSSAKLKNYQFRVAEVSYYPQGELDCKAKKIGQDLNEAFKISRAIDALYMKRQAFDHEKEWRGTLYAKSVDLLQEQKGFTVPVDPYNFIDRILLDPRAPDELVRAFKFFFQEHLGFEGNVQRSALYKSPDQIEIEEVLVDQL